MTYKEARELLDRLPRFEVKPGLERVDRLLRAVGLPQETFPAVHVAGTNGKGSVVAMLDAILRAAGLRVGRYTSPELVDFRDRITIDGRWLSEHEWAAGVRRLAPAILSAQDVPAQFEAITALALDAFSRTGIDMVAPFGAELHVSGRDKKALDAAIAAAKKQDGAHRWKRSEPSLEDVFIGLMDQSKDNFV